MQCLYTFMQKWIDEMYLTIQGLLNYIFENGLVH